MSVDVNLITNCDDAVVFWRIAKKISGCWGFSVDKEQKLPNGQVVRTPLDNRMGFASDNPRPGEHRPSSAWPYQRFWWADYTANLGDVVRYRVTPMIRSGAKLDELISERSEWTGWTELSGGKRDGFSSFFNRGLVISQFMARYLEDLRKKEGLATRKDALKAFKKRIGDHELPIRKFLAGALRDRMLKLLADAKKAGHHVYGALYELEDDELIGGIAALGKRAHIVLANGSIQAKKGVPAAELRKTKDQNASARKELKEAKVEVFKRALSPGALGHNKFLVVTDKQQKALAAWTGSTNWTPTGLCTQINNGLHVANRAVADEFMEQWKRLRDAKSEFPASLVTANSKPKPVSSGKTSARIWFSRTKGKVDLDAIDDVLGKAQDGILFLMFQPGGTGTLGTVRGLQKSKKSLYIRGVVSTLPPANGDDDSAVGVDIHTGGAKSSLALDVVQPRGIKTPFASWAATVTRDEFITMQGGVIGFAIVHSKLIVVDPFTKPVVITGSHNFSASASQKNDENFIIIKDNPELASAYAAHILAVYHHYKWLAFADELQRKGKTPDGALKENDLWQERFLKGDAKREMEFWMR